MAKAKAAKPRPRKPTRKRGQAPHIPTGQTLATCRAMARVGYPQAVIARHIGISEPTLRAHYRHALDNSTEEMCARVFVNLVRTATTKSDMAGVNAAKFILCVRAGWKETSKLEIEEQGAGITGLLRIVDEARRSPDFEEPDIDAQIEAAKTTPEWAALDDAFRRTHPPMKPN